MKSGPSVARKRDVRLLSITSEKAHDPSVAAPDPSEGSLRRAHGIGLTASCEAVDTIGWFSTLISAKIRRAICGQADGWESPDGVQTDHNGSAKVALLGIAESRAAWGVLMEAGKATADGVPAQAVRILDELDRNLRTRFPRATEFVRPGFDETGVSY